MRYYSTQRPVAPGTFPKPEGNKILDIHNYDRKTYCPEIGGEAWGYIDYKRPITPEQAASYELTPAADTEGGLTMEDIVKILMERDDLSHQEAQQMVEECRQRLQDEAIPTGDIELAEEILAEELGLELDYMMDLIL